MRFVRFARREKRSVESRLGHHHVHRLDLLLHSIAFTLSSSCLQQADRDALVDDACFAVACVMRD